MSVSKFKAKDKQALAALLQQQVAALLDARHLPLPESN
jgi:hypothetical protein